MIKHVTICILILSLISISCSKKSENIDEIKPDTITQGRIDFTQIVKSEILDRDMHYTVYLPPGYTNSTKDYPVLYLLHGMWGNYLDWYKNDMASTLDVSIHIGSSKKMIVIMPDGMDSFYCNNYNNGNMRYEDFFIQEFIPKIESRYRIKSSGKNRAIAGLSMGGYGATFHAFKRPEMFCCCYSMSGALDMGISAPDLKEIVNTKDSKELENLPSFTIECGTNDNLVYNSNVSFHNFLLGKGIEHNYISRSGSHDWLFWNACLPKVISEVSHHFEE